MSEQPLIKSSGYRITTLAGLLTHPSSNRGSSSGTAAFPDKYKALAFEKYLKSHSGRAFTKKRL